MMLENTDLSFVKEMAKSFVYLPVEKTDMYPSFLSFPDFSAPLSTT